MATGAFDLETKTEVARLLFEAQMATEAAAMGCEAVGRTAEGWRDKTKVRAVARLIAQAADALAELHRELEPHLQAEAAFARLTPAERLEIARAALAFYADATSWLPHGDNPAAHVDAGAAARMALLEMAAGCDHVPEARHC